MQMGVSYTDMTFFTLSQYDLVSSNLSLSLNANFTVTKWQWFNFMWTTVTLQIVSLSS